MKTSEIIGLSLGMIQSVKNYASNLKFWTKKGHGFTAEKVNTWKDKSLGRKAKVVGGNNTKNGADRLVDGVQVQSKYCKSGSKCISDCFEDNKFRYWNNDGTPMQIEVPSDPKIYDAAIQAMEDRIKKGQVAGVSDPAKAKEIIRKGHYSHAQVENIAKFGSIEGLTYDAVNGIKLAGSAMGISAIISFAVAIWNGKTWKKAIKEACYTGFKVGGISWVSSMITAQLGRTSIENGMRPMTDWVVKKLGSKLVKRIVNAIRPGSPYGGNANEYLSKVIRGNLVAGAVTTVVFSTPDFIRLFRRRVSALQLVKNVTITGAGVVGGTGGWLAGATAGAAIGSLLPGAGNIIGSVIGGILGSISGGVASSSLVSLGLGQFIEDDAKKMITIIEEEFYELAITYLLTEGEGEAVFDELLGDNVPKKLMDMHASKNRNEFARILLLPLIKYQVQKRKYITPPTDKEIIQVVDEILKESLAS